MSCETTGGNLLGCKTTGGIRYFYVADFSDVVSTTVTSGVITAMTMASGSPAPKFYKFEVLRDTSNFDVTTKGSPENGTEVFEQVLNLSFNEITAARNLVYESLAKARTVTIAVDQNGRAFFFGRNNGLDMTGGTIASGKKGEDFNGYTAVLTATEPTPLYEFSMGLFTTMSSTFV